MGASIPSFFANSFADLDSQQSVRLNTVSAAQSSQCGPKQTGRLGDSARLDTDRTTKHSQFDGPLDVWQSGVLAGRYIAYLLHKESAQMQSSGSWHSEHAVNVEAPIDAQDLGSRA